MDMLAFIAMLMTYVAGTHVRSTKNVSMMAEISPVSLKQMSHFTSMHASHQNKAREQQTEQ